MTKLGQNTRKQRNGQTIEPRTINQFRPLVEAFSRFSVGPGLSQQQFVGGIPFLRLVGIGWAIARAGPEGITAADWTDPDNVVLGTGLVEVYVREAGGVLIPRGALEDVFNFYAGTVAGGLAPLLLVKIDGVWTLVTFGCPPA